MPGRLTSPIPTGRRLDPGLIPWGIGVLLCPTAGETPTAPQGTHRPRRCELCCSRSIPPALGDAARVQPPHSRGNAVGSPVCWGGSSGCSAGPTSARGRQVHPKGRPAFLLPCLPERHPRADARAEAVLPKAKASTSFHTLAKAEGSPQPLLPNAGGRCGVPCGVPVLGFGVQGPCQTLPGDGGTWGALGMEGFRGVRGYDGGEVPVGDLGMVGWGLQRWDEVAGGEEGAGWV